MHTVKLANTNRCIAVSNVVGHLLGGSQHHSQPHTLTSGSDLHAKGEGEVGVGRDIEVEDEIEREVESEVEVRLRLRVRARLKMTMRMS